ncbi:hypothetical protein V500_04129 [Pseudogymnoascus sp. VKM F-4518 (FW-2643)]|nr:hypothetical protein V500_04129 [Pseudogymnoascus sp. VKM F-4518 (FW-2643)]
MKFSKSAPAKVAPPVLTGPDSRSETGRGDAPHGQAESGSSGDLHATASTGCSSRTVEDIRARPEGCGPHLHKRGT